jgi:membrane-bound lytic murein transglycosylase F
MKYLKISKIRWVIYFLFCILSITYALKQDYSFSRESSDDLKQISDRKRLVAVIDQNSTDYFAYKGEPMGFQFEMLKQLGQFLGMEVEIIVSNNMDEDFQALFEGKVDIIAKSMAPNTYKTDLFTNSLPLYNTKHVLVQRKSLLNIRNFIENTDKLTGQNIYIPIRSAFSTTLNSINEENGGRLNMYEMPGYTAERLVELVATKQIDYTVCNFEQAKMMQEDYPELDFSTILSNNNSVSWIFRKKSTELQKRVNSWLSYYRASSQFAVKYHKYFEDRNSFANISHHYVNLHERKISKYDQLIKKYSSKIDWDWRLLASLIYQESRFNPNVRSHAGAFGIMQLMPSTREYFGVDTSSTVEEQIEAGVKLIKLLDKQIASKIPDKKERIKFVLASYNVGLGHIMDAVSIAERIGKNSQKWDNNVDSCLLSKSNPKVFRSGEIRFGYVRGVETYMFVKEVLKRFENYQNLVLE